MTSIPTQAVKEPAYQRINVAAHETAPISVKQTTVARQAIEQDYTIQKTHSVGQLVHNLHKIKRVLEKVNYPGKVSETQLESGDPKVFTAILKFLVFRASN